jgi:hypothetical protein
MTVSPWNVATPWKEPSPRHFVADAHELGVVYALVGGEGVFRRGTGWSLIWDCPQCERRVRLASHWTHSEPCDDGCICDGWYGVCACGASIAIELWPGAA